MSEQDYLITIIIFLTIWVVEIAELEKTEPPVVVRAMAPVQAEAVTE